MNKWWWFPYLLAGQIVDLVQTSRAGVEQEGNLLMVYAWQRLGWGTVVGIKVLTVLVVVAACWFLHHPKNPIRWMRWAFHVEIIVVLATLLNVILWNWTQLGG